MERVDGNEDVPHVCVNEPPLVALPQLRHQHTLREGKIDSQKNSTLGSETDRVILTSSMTSSDARSSTILDVASNFSSFLRIEQTTVCTNEEASMTCKYAEL